jgi:hypothetical protein
MTAEVKADMLEREFSARSAAPGGNLLLLPAPDALALVDRAAEEGVPILGVETFRVTGRGTEPLLDQLADFSPAVAEGHGCWADAEQFLRAHGTAGLLFELTLGDDPIEAV